MDGWSFEMRILKACLDQELLWVIDDVIGGLYSIDLKTFETECVIDCWELFPHGYFGIQSLIKWKENYIVIIPLEISRNWIFYNKVTKEIEYRKVVEQKYPGRLIAIDQDRNCLYFFSVVVHGPILIVDLDTLTCSQMIENWSGKLQDSCFETAWTGTYDGQYVFYPQKNTQFIVRIECRTRKVNLVKLDIQENVIDVNYAFGELWVLPMRGNRLYQIDENGLIIKIVELSIEDASDSIPNFARLVVQKRYLFLVPCYRNGIYVYDKREEKTYIIQDPSLLLEKKDKEFYLRYWEYYIKDNRICFLPNRSNYIEIDLDTLIHKKKELLYPIIWSDKEKICRYIWSHISEQEFVIRETEECDLHIFLNYMRYGIDIENFLKTENVGEVLWNRLIDRFF